MNPSTIRALAQREIADALRNRWFLAYSLAFVLLTVALAVLVIRSAGYGGISGFGRTSAGLINLVLFLAPLMGLTLGAQAIAGERERGTLAYLLAQPVSLAELFVSKFIGLGLALTAAVVTGFALSTMTIIYLSDVEGVSTFLGLTGYTVLLVLASLAIGCLISSCTQRTATALGVAIVVWLALVLVGDLGLMGTAVMLELSPGALLGWTMVNPLEVFRIVAISELRDSLELLGPSGLVATERFGGALRPTMFTILLLWTVIPLALAYVILSRSEQS